MEEDNSNKNAKRISPLRGQLTHNDIVNQTKIVNNGLSSLRDDHYFILANIREEYENERNANSNTITTKEAGKDDNDNNLLEERISNVTQSLEKLEIGIEESAALLSLSDHFERLEADRSTLRLEMGRVQDENDWLREELANTQREMREALLELTDLREEKKKWDFEEELKNTDVESKARPITPSKIPVGAFRVELEKDINRALNGGTASGSSTRSQSPAPSKIPVGGWRTRLPVYKSLMDKEETRQNSSRTSRDENKRQYFNINARLSTSRSKIPSR